MGNGRGGLGLLLPPGLRWAQRRIAQDPPCPASAPACRLAPQMDKEHTAGHRFEVRCGHTYCGQPGRVGLGGREPSGSLWPGAPHSPDDHRRGIMLPPPCIRVTARPLSAPPPFARRARARPHPAGQELRPRPRHRGPAGRLGPAGSHLLCYDACSRRPMPLGLHCARGLAVLQAPSPPAPRPPPSPRAAAPRPCTPRARSGLATGS
jgi:hypothetical protein